MWGRQALGGEHGAGGEGAGGGGGDPAAGSYTVRFRHIGGDIGPFRFPGAVPAVRLKELVVAEFSAGASPGSAPLPPLPLRPPPTHLCALLSLPHEPLVLGGLPYWGCLLPPDARGSLRGCLRLLPPLALWNVSFFPPSS